MRHRAEFFPSFEIPKILEGIPIEECTQEEEFVSGKPMLRAPEGKAFRVEGVFSIVTDDSQGGMNRPSDSRQLYVSTEEGRRGYERLRRRREEDLRRRLNEEYLWNGRYDRDFAWNRFDEWYEEYLKQNPFSDEEVWEELQQDEWAHFPDFFVGKWLAIEGNELGDTQIVIRAIPEVGVVVDSGFASLETLMSASSQEEFIEEGTEVFPAHVQEKYYEVPLSSTEWTQDSVAITIDATDTRVLFVDYQEEREIEASKMPDQSPGLILPVKEGLISSSVYMEKVLGRTSYTEDERIAAMRSRRRLGRSAMFSDDPLLHTDFNLCPDPCLVEDLGLSREVVLPKSESQPEIISSASAWREEQIKRAYYDSQKLSDLEL